MESGTAGRLAKVASRQTLRLVHRGRRSGKDYEVTIWFMVDGDTVYLATANQARGWVRNVRVNPHVTLKIGSESFQGEIERLDSPPDRERVLAMVRRKYWIGAPYLWLAQTLAALGLVKDSSETFRVKISP